MSLELTEKKKIQTFLYHFIVTLIILIVMSIFTDCFVKHCLYYNKYGHAFTHTHKLE